MLTNSKRVTFGIENATYFGTTRAEYRLWVDYIFDWFGATLERTFRRWAVSIAFATAIILVGLGTVTPFGFARTYLTSPGIYILWIGAAWCIYSLRWLSQTYHLRTNLVRSCFQQTDDDEYKRIVSPYAARATRNRQIFARSLPIAFLTWVYFAAVMYAGGHAGAVLQSTFPRSLPSTWHTGGNLLPKLIVLDFFSAVAIVHVFTGARLTLATTPLYGRLSQLPVIPIPGLVSELFSGILDLYQSGTLMWSFGLVLAELLFDARLNFLGITFVAVVAPLGLVAYSFPRVAVRTIVSKSRGKAVNALLSGLSSEPSNTPELSKIMKWNRYMGSLTNMGQSKLTLNRIVNLAVGQILPALPLVINTLGKHRFG